ncbi:MAG: YvcK family protein [bacterium]|nr:YvcK family protein [bacterium]
MAKKIVVIGGGTGTYVALTGLREYDVTLTAVVTMMDSGGSTGRLRDQLGVLPPGDIRQALVALSESDEIWRKMFTYRFDTGDLSGHNFGNIFLSALEKMTGDFSEALKLASELLQIKGQVLPVTYSKSDLCVELEDGQVIEGETYIDELEADKKRSKIKRAYLKPKAPINDAVRTAIQEADIVLIGPGDLYTSLLVNLLVDGVVDALSSTNAKVVYALNLMTKYGQTTSYTAQDHVTDLEQYLGKGVLDYILVNNAKPEDNTLKLYEKEQEILAVDNLKEDGYRVVHADMLADLLIQKPKSDQLKRSLIRHDPDKLAKVIMSLG